MQRQRTQPSCLPVDDAMPAQARAQMAQQSVETAVKRGPKAPKRKRSGEGTQATHIRFQDDAGDEPKAKKRKHKKQVRSGLLTRSQYYKLQVRAPVDTQLSMLDTVLSIMMPTSAEVSASHAAVEHGVWMLEHGSVSPYCCAVSAPFVHTGRLGRCALSAHTAQALWNGSRIQGAAKSAKKHSTAKSAKKYAGAKAPRKQAKGKPFAAKRLAKTGVGQKSQHRNQ